MTNTLPEKRRAAQHSHGAKLLRVAHPVNLLLRMNLYERAAHPAFCWRGGAFLQVNRTTPRAPPFLELAGRHLRDPRGASTPRFIAARLIRHAAWLS